MPPVTPQRLALYVAVAVVVLAIGWRMQPGGSAGAASYSQSPVRAVSSAPSDPPVVVVDVVGAVRRPGVLRLPSGARVLDAVRRAHPTRRADLAGINLAARLAGGEQVVVPRRGGGGVAVAPAATGSPSAPVHLNSATLEQLE